MSVPADHSATIANMGKLRTASIIASSALSYRRTASYLLQHGKIRSLFNFLYTKTFVPTGEGSGEAAYYVLADILQRFPRLAPFPRYIETEMTSYCNKKCIICEHTWWNQPSRHLAFGDFFFLANQFNLRWINLTGEGDAFLNPDYLDIIDYLKRRGTSVYLVDSFDLITHRVATSLVRYGVDGIYISMDGATPETYETIKVGCDFSKVVANIENLLRAKRAINSPIPEICFRYVVTNKNAHEMADFVRMINVLGTKSDWGDGSKIHFVGLLDFPEVHHLYMSQIPEEYIQAALNVKSDIPVVFAHTAETTNPSINRCLAWMEPYFALVPKPMMLPCCAVLMSNSRYMLEEYSFGNYREEYVRDMWNHPYYKWFRRTVTNKHAKVPRLCQGCRAYDTKEREQRYGVDYRKREDFE